MGQHTYTLKFSIVAAYSKDAHLDAELAEGVTREDSIKAKVEKRIAEVIPEMTDLAMVTFDELTES